VPVGACTSPPARAATAVGIVVVVYLSVLLWWRNHESIAQELG
jgi:hypothetical protein